MTKKTTIAILATVLLAGCAAPKQESPTSAESLASPSATSSSLAAPQTVAATPTPTASDIPVVTSTPEPGPAVLFCNETFYAINIMDTVTGGTHGYMDFSPVETPTFACDLGAPGGQMAGSRYRQIFSEDFSRLAVNWTDSTTNSRRVGYVDQSSGQTVDVTALISGEGGFGAVPQHNNALFSPDGQFFFYDVTDHTHNWVDLDSGEITQTTPVEGNAESWWIGQDGLPESTFNMSGIGYAKEIRTSDPSLVIDLFDDTQVSNWFDGTRALAVKDGQLGVLDPQSGDINHETAANFTAVTPASDFDIGSAVADPTLETVYFTAARGEEHFFFKVPADGSAEPERFGAINPGEFPLFVGFKE